MSDIENESDQTLEPQAEAPQEAQAEAPQAQPQEAPKPPQTVPLAALMEERNKRRDMEAELQRLRQMSEASTAELRKLAEQLQPKPPPPPSIDTDPLGYIQHENEALKGKLSEFDTWRREQEQQRQREAAANAVTQRFQADAMAFAASAPDFQEAYLWVSEQVLGDLRASGLPDAVARQRGQQIALDIVNHAASTGGNAAEGFYRLAKQRGWTGPQQQRQAPAPAATPPVEAIRRAQQAGSGVSGPGAGQKGYDGLTAQQLASMSQEDYERVPDNVRRRVLRGG